jgi:hypothetical protein
MVFIFLAKVHFICYSPIWLKTPPDGASVTIRASHTVRNHKVTLKIYTCMTSEAFTKGIIITDFLMCSPLPIAVINLKMNWKFELRLV